MNADPQSHVLELRERTLTPEDGLLLGNGDLSVSVKTIDTHRQHIMDKLDIHNIAELTRYAIREGLTTADTHPRVH